MKLLQTIDYYLDTRWCWCYRASVVEIVAGARDLSQNEPSQVTVTSRDMTLHVNYDATRLTDDISLIKLSSPMSFNGKDLYSRYFYWYNSTNIH